MSYLWYNAGLFSRHDKGTLRLDKVAKITYRTLFIVTNLFFSIYYSKEKSILR